MPSDFKSLASASFATAAYEKIIQLYLVLIKNRGCRLILSPIHVLFCRADIADSFIKRNYKLFGFSVQ